MQEIRAFFECKFERKYPQNEGNYPQNRKGVTLHGITWVEILIRVFFLNLIFFLGFVGNCKVQEYIYISIYASNSKLEPATATFSWGSQGIVREKFKPFESSKGAPDLARIRRELPSLYNGPSDEGSFVEQV